MVGIPNKMLSTMASSVKAAEKWVSKNVSQHISSFNVNIRSAFFHSLVTFSLDYLYAVLWMDVDVIC